MPNAIKTVESSQVLADDPNRAIVVRDYLRGRTSMDEAVRKFPKERMSFLMLLLKLFLPYEILRRHPAFVIQHSLRPHTVRR